MIIPAIFEKDFEEVEKKLSLIKEFVSWVQIDVSDGEMVAGKSFELELLTRTSEIYDNLLYDVHLMVKEPENWIKKAVHAGASRIIGQVEMMSDRENFIGRSKDEGLEAGLAFDANSEIDARIPQDTDIILLMGRKAGFGKYPIEQKIYERVNILNHIRQEDGLKFKIAVDGGISLDNIKDLKRNGVEVFYCTGAIFNGNIEDNISKLKKYVEQR